MFIEIPVQSIFSSSQLVPDTLSHGSDHAGSGAPQSVWEGLHQAGQEMHQT